jgi:glucose-1-phosphate adenylyltransferase
MNIVALVLAGGEGSRLYPLTAEHAKPALPFARGLRIVDFVMSNLVNSGISTIYLLAQYKPESLIRHVESAWAPRLEETGGRAKVLLPRTNTLAGQFKGTADAVYHCLDVVQEHGADLVAVFAADHVYRMDVRQMAAFHEERNAGLTVAAVPVPLSRASHFGILTADADGRVREFREKPRDARPMPGDPTRAYASMGNYLFEPELLESVLNDARSRGDSDFGRDILPRLCTAADVYAYDFSANRVPGLRSCEEPAYWRDVGTLPALADAQQDVLAQPPRFNLWNRRWPIRGEPDGGLVHTRTVRPAAPAPAVAEAAPRWPAGNRARHNDERALPS